MKKYLFLVAGGLLLWTGCKEKHQLVAPTPVISGPDSTYVVNPVPAADLHNVLVEEFTGQSCSNCPAAHAMLESISAAHPGRINVIGLYITNFSQTNPVPGSSHDFRDSVAFDIGTTIFGGISALPIGSVERMPGDQGLLSYSGSWTDKINNRLSALDSINLSVQSTYDAATNKATIKVNMIYVQPVAIKQNLSVAIVEDSMIDKQESGTTVDDSYLFTNVFRGMVSSEPWGDAVLDSMAVKTAGRGYQRTYTYTPRTLTPAIVPAHCRVIAFVGAHTTTSDYHIMQSAQCKLVP
jgi:hypothetical protein